MVNSEITEIVLPFVMWTEQVQTVVYEIRLPYTCLDAYGHLHNSLHNNMRSVSIACCLETVQKTIQVTLKGADLLIYHSYRQTSIDEGTTLQGAC